MIQHYDKFMFVVCYIYLDYFPSQTKILIPLTANFLYLEFLCTVNKVLWFLVSLRWKEKVHCVFRNIQQGNTNLYENPAFAWRNLYI